MLRELGSRSGGIDERAGGEQGEGGRDGELVVSLPQEELKAQVNNNTSIPHRRDSLGTYLSERDLKIKYSRYHFALAVSYLTTSVLHHHAGR